MSEMSEPKAMPVPTEPGHYWVWPDAAGPIVVAQVYWRGDPHGIRPPGLGFNYRGVEYAVEAAHRWLSGKITPPWEQQPVPPPAPLEGESPFVRVHDGQIRSLFLENDEIRQRLYKLENTPPKGTLSREDLEIEVDSALEVIAREIESGQWPHAGFNLHPKSRHIVSRALRMMGERLTEELSQ